MRYHFLVLSFLACTVASYWVGFNRGIHSNKVSIESRTWIKPDKWKSIQDGCKIRFDREAKEK